MKKLFAAATVFLLLFGLVHLSRRTEAPKKASSPDQAATPARHAADRGKAVEPEAAAPAANKPVEARKAPRIKPNGRQRSENKENEIATASAPAQTGVADNATAAGKNTKAAPARLFGARPEAEKEEVLIEPFTGMRLEPPFVLPPGQPLLQSPARPLDLKIIGAVEASVKDPGYVAFVEEVLPIIEPELDKRLVDWKNMEDKTVNLEMEDLELPEDAYVRVYFIKEGTAWYNSLGIIRDGEEKLIFPNASSVSSFHKDADTRQKITSEKAPLLPGDYVDVGLMKKGELLDLFLIQDGARRDNGPMFGIDKESNPDKTNHVKIHDILDDHTLVIGFEDLPVDHPMADRDYNDLVIAVEMIPVDREDPADPLDPADLVDPAE